MVELRMSESNVVTLVKDDVTGEYSKPVTLNFIGRFVQKIEQMQENYKKSFQKKNKPEVVSNAKTADGIVRDVNKSKSAGDALKRELAILVSVRDGLTVENIPNAILAITAGSIAVDFAFYMLDKATPLPLIVSLLPMAGLGLIGYCVKAYLDIVEPKYY